MALFKIIIAVILGGHTVYIMDSALLIGKDYGLFHRNPDKTQNEHASFVSRFCFNAGILWVLSSIFTVLWFKLPWDAAFFSVLFFLSIICAGMHMIGDVYYRKRTPSWH
jgi:hypothetical protein